MSRAQAIAAHLTTATGRDATVTRRADHIRVEVTFSLPLSGARWTTLLHAVATGDRFGLDSDESSNTAWATIGVE